MESLQLNDILILFNIVAVSGGAFYLVGRLGAKIDGLSNAIRELTRETHTHRQTLSDHESRIVRLEKVGT